MLRRLSATQAARLIYLEAWDSGAIALDRGLEPEELAGSLLLRQARTLLQRLAVDEGVKLTTTGRFPRAYVDEMLDALGWRDHSRRTAGSSGKTLNEMDVWPLHVMRLLLEVARLTRKRKGRLHLTREGRRLLPPERAGELLAVLFHAMFRDFNLAYFSYARLGGHMQTQAVLTLYMIGCEARDWISPEELMRRSVVPDEEMLHAREGLAHHAFRARILGTLDWFGLIEKRRLPADPEWASMSEVRTTPLFHRFLSFDIG